MATPTPRRDLRLLGVVCAWLFVGVVWSLAIPPLEAPDETAHVDMVRHIVDERGYPRDPITVDVATVSARAWVLGLADGRRFTDVVPPRADRPSFADLTTDATFDAPNQMVQHPPLGYAHLVAAEALIRVAPGDPAFDLHLWLLRLTTLALGTAIPVLIARAVRALRGSPTQALVGALLPLTIPQLAASLGTVGNDVPLVVAAAAAAVAAARLVTDRRRSGTALGVAIGLGALTKGFGLALFVLPVVTLLDRPRRWSPVAAGVASGIAAWWWIWNVARFGSVQTHGVPLEALYGAPLEHGPGFTDWLTRAGPRLVDRFWGAFGSFSLHIGLPRWATLSASLAMVVLAARGVARGGAAARPFACAHGLLLIGSLAVLTWGAFDLFTTYGVLLGVQGRYLFAVVPGVAVLVGLGVGRQSTRAAPATLLAIAGIQAFALWRVLDGWWGRPDDDPVERLRAMAGWCPVPPALVGVLLGALLLSGSVCLLRSRPDDPDPAKGAPVAATATLLSP